jgi:PAS domain S-box-containing protein
MSAVRQFGDSGVSFLDLRDVLGIDRSRTRYVLALVLLAVIYFAAAKFGLSLASVHTNVSPVWPPTGIAVAAVLLLGYRMWPGIFLGAFLSNFLTPVPVASAGLIAVGNTLEAVCAVWALNGLGFHRSFDRARDVFKFAAVMLICTMLCATIGNLSLALDHAARWSDFRSLWITWWLGDVTGAVTVTPLILTWACGENHWLPKRRYFEATVLILLLSASAIATFGGKSPTPVYYYPLTRLMIPFLLWAAFRLGRRGVSVAVAVISAFAIWGTWQGFGPFIGGGPNNSLLLLQLFIASNALTFLALVTVVEEKNVAEGNRREDARQLQSNLAVTSILAESPEISIALERILATVGLTLGWEFGCVWTPSANGTVLRTVATWQAGSKAPQFEATSRTQAFEKGVGLPGRVWATLKPTWIPDVGRDDNFPRAPVAINESLHSAFAFPILVNDRLAGVVEFFSLEIRQPNQAMLAMFAGIGTQIGQFMERKRIEAAVESASLLPKENPSPVIRLTGEGTVAYANPAAQAVLGFWGVSIHETAPKDIVEVARRVLARGEPDVFEVAVGDHSYAIDVAPVTPANYVNLYFNDISEIKRAEAALRESEARYRSVIEALPAAVYTTDAEGRITMFNQAAVELSGRVPEVGTDSWCVTWKLYHPDGTPMPHDECPMAMALKQGRPVLGYEAIAERPDGTRINFIPYPTPLTDDNGNLIGAINMLVDITDRKRTEIALKESERELTEFFENASEAIHWVGPDGTILRANKAELRMLGYSAEEYIGKNIADFHVSQQNAADIMALLHRGETLHSYPAQMIAKEGSIRDVLINSSVYFENGQFIHTRCFTRDVTDQLKIEKDLRHMAAIVETTDDAVISKDLDAIITSWNPAAERLYGYKAEEVIGKSVTILIPEERPDEEPAILKRLRRGERIDHYETVRVAKDGRRLHVSLTVSPIRDATGKIIGASKIARDITQQKNTQDEIARLLAAERAARQDAEVASRTKDEFLAVLSHELRTPLTAMLGWLSILRGHTLDEKTTVHAIETIERNARAQAQLIEDLVDISRIVGGKLSLEVSPIDLRPVINAAVDVVRPAADAKEITINLNFDPHVGPVSGDPSRLQQIIWNLLSNAVKFTPKGGSVNVDFRQHDSHAEIVVRDNGIGISPEFLPHVFERFRQAESTATRSHRGMGLGLAIVRHLVELHGGTVWAASDGENQGSSFMIHLPLAAVQKSSPGPAFTGQSNREHQNDLKGLRILLVEDEPDARELIAMVLQGSGASVEAVDSAGDALKRLPLFIPDLLLSDIGLPRESGYDLIKKVRLLSSNLNKVPAIALTAFATESDRTMSLSAGFQAHLAKPVEPTDLVATIKSVLNGSS